MAGGLSLSAPSRCYFRPRVDQAARRERRLETASNEFARDLMDTLEVVHRGVAKMLGTEPPPLPFKRPERASSSADEDDGRNQ